MTGGEEEEEGEIEDGGEGVVGEGEDEKGGVGVVVEVVLGGRGEDDDDDGDIDGEVVVGGERDGIDGDDRVGGEDERGTELEEGNDEEGGEGDEGGDWVEGEKSRRLICPPDGAGLRGACPDVGAGSDGPAVMEEEDDESARDEAKPSLPDCGMWWSVTTVRRGSKASSFADPRSVNQMTSWTVWRSRTFSSSNCLTNSTSWGMPALSNARDAMAPEVIPSASIWVTTRTVV